MKKAILILIFTLGALGAFSQDCYSPNTLIVISGQVGFSSRSMIPQAKIGLWRNVHPSGWTAFVGYRMDQPMTRKTNKGIDTSFYSSGFMEFGYKERINDQFFLHLYAGGNKFYPYLGADLMYQFSWDALVSVGYREKNINVGVTIRL